MDVTVETLRRVNRADWDERVASAPEGTLYQTAMYAEDLNRVYREAPLFASVRCGAQVMGQWLFSYGSLVRDALVGAPFSSIAIPMLRGFSGAQYGGYGPLIFVREEAGSVLQKLLSVMDRLAALRNAAGTELVLHPFLSVSMRQQMEEAMREKPFEREPRATVLLDLNERLEALWDKLQPDGRQKVRRAQSQGITVREALSPEDIEAFYRVRLQTVRRNGLRRLRRSWLLKGRSTYGPCQRIFLSCRGHEVLAGQLLRHFNGVGFLGMVAIADCALERKLYANDLLQWQIIAWAKANGLRQLDWSGYALQPSAKEEGINRFKLKWGGAVVRYETWMRRGCGWKYRWVQQARSLKRYARREN